MYASVEDFGKSELNLLYLKKDGTLAWDKNQKNGSYKVLTKSLLGIELDVNYTSPDGNIIAEKWYLRRVFKDDEYEQKAKTIFGTKYTEFRDIKTQYLIAIEMSGGDISGTKTIFCVVPYDYKNTPQSLYSNEEMKMKRKDIHIFLKVPLFPEHL